MIKNTFWKVEKKPHYLFYSYFIRHKKHLFKILGGNQIKDLFTNFGKITMQLL